MMIILFIFFLAGNYNMDQTAIKVVVRNIQVGKGSIIVEIYSDRKEFLKNARSSQIKRAISPVMEFSFDVQIGEYAISAYQDLNDNKKLDAGLFHIPKEPYGFSNNYRPKFSAPYYEDCLIRVTSQTTATIDLK
jgi:uncharacterized protein (DUF2141 family)